VGFFDFLSGHKQSTRMEVVSDRVWMTTDAKFAGLANEVVERSASGTVAVLLVAHFPDVLARLSQIAAQPTVVPVKALLARDLTPDLAASLQLDRPATIDVIVAERHPLPSADNSLAAFASAFPCGCRMSYHLSLDDAVMKVFAGAWVHGMLRKLGMTEDEAIEGNMIVRRIKEAQRKIASRSFADLDANSAEEWLKTNCPELGHK
jgi:preprotein translocase subunit SecA